MRFLIVACARRGGNREDGICRVASREPQTSGPVAGTGPFDLIHCAASELRFRWLLFCGLGRLIAGLTGFFAACLHCAAGELVLSLVALAAEAGRAASRACWRVSFISQLQQDDVAGVTDAEVAGLDDAGVTAAAAVELR